jgi:hypothetical protein
VYALGSTHRALVPLMRFAGASPGYPPPLRCCGVRVVAALAQRLTVGAVEAARTLGTELVHVMRVSRACPAAVAVRMVAQELLREGAPPGRVAELVRVGPQARVLTLVFGAAAGGWLDAVRAAIGEADRHAAPLAAKFPLSRWSGLRLTGTS